MKKTVGLIFCLAALGISLTACNAPAESPASSSSVSGATSETSSNPVVIKSEMFGKEYEISYDKAPQRVVSLAGFSTEMLLALGLEDKIVGYAWQDNEVLPEYRDTFAKLHKLSDQDPGVEGVLAVEPDFYSGWAGDDRFTYEQCQKYGMTTYGPYCELQGADLESVYTDFINLGKIFQVEDRAEALVAEMRSNIEAVEKRVADKAPVSVFVCDVSSTEEQAFTAGGGLVADILEKAGGKNIIEGIDTNWAHVSWEVVGKADPDWIVIDYYNTGKEDVDATIAFLKKHPATKDLEAVKQEKFIPITLTEISASERNDDSVEYLASYFHPEKQS